MLVSTDKKWNYVLGTIKVDGLEPSPEFKKLVDIIDVYQEKARRSDEEFDEGSKSIYHAIAKFYERIFKDIGRIHQRKGSAE